jgi:hypothetical protein
LKICDLKRRVLWIKSKIGGPPSLLGDPWASFWLKNLRALKGEIKR